MKLILKCIAVFVISIILNFVVIISSLWLLNFGFFAFLIPIGIYFVIYLICEKVLTKKLHIPLKHYIFSALIIPTVLFGISYGVVQYLINTNYYSEGFAGLAEVIITFALFIMNASALLLRGLFELCKRLRKKHLKSKLNK